jgi:hypothetical protein
MVEKTQLTSFKVLRSCSKKTQDYTIEDEAGKGNASVDVVTHKKFQEWGECAMK